ncbi:MAG: hypothetical protein KF764_33705 [Labilithrix sp.]|nr:hypothetical protein [Labilithrix sp.]
MHPSAHVEKLRAARLTMLLSWCGIVSAHVVGWGTVGWVLTSHGARHHVGELLAAATIATFLFNVAAVGLAIVSLVMGRRRCSPWPAIASLVFGVLGFAGTVGLFFFWGFASIGIK